MSIEELPSPFANSPSYNDVMCNNTNITFIVFEYKVHKKYLCFICAIIDCIATYIQYAVAQGRLFHIITIAGG